MSTIKTQPNKLSPFSLTDHSSKQLACSHDHRRRNRKFHTFLPLILIITLFILLGVLFFLGDTDDLASGAAEGFYMLKRQVSSGGSSTATSNQPFVKNKLYLIVVIVGFFVVVLLAIMLSAWCCRGAFQNPLCCPCYLCACCGGLACLECIGCGLCAEGLSDLNV